MLQLFKIIGLIMCFLACAGMGFLKSLTLRKRKDKLTSFYLAILQLAEYIKADGAEIGLLSKRCFSENEVVLNNGKPTLNKSFLEKEDVSLIEEFLSEFGIRDISGEYKRTQLYASLIEKKREQAARKCSELCKIYNILGVLSGVVICIFFI